MGKRTLPLDKRWRTLEVLALERKLHRLKASLFAGRVAAGTAFGKSSCRHRLGMALKAHGA